MMNRHFFPPVFVVQKNVIKMKTEQYFHFSFCHVSEKDMECNKPNPSGLLFVRSLYRSTK